MDALAQNSEIPEDISLSLKALGPEKQVGALRESEAADDVGATNEVGGGIDKGEAIVGPAAIVAEGMLV